RKACRASGARAPRLVMARRSQWGCDWSSGMRTELGVNILAKVLYSAIRSLEALGKIPVSAIIASSNVATSASPLSWEPDTALAKRRRYGRCGAIAVERLMWILSLTCLVAERTARCYPNHVQTHAQKKGSEKCSAAGNLLRRYAFRRDKMTGVAVRCIAFRV